MAVQIENLEVQQFRGIHRLSIPQLNHINIIAGDNNCGKTSFLEALLLLREPRDIVNVMRIARQRDNITMFRAPSLFDSFLSLFPPAEGPEEPRWISLEADCRGHRISFALDGKIQTVMLDQEEQRRGPYSTVRNPRRSLPSECQGFVGERVCKINGSASTEPVLVHEYTSYNGLGVSSMRFLNMIYLSPFEHLRGNVFSRILTNDFYKDLCLHILHLFDPQIADLLLVKSETTGRPVECIRHERLGVMPLSTYGDGIKKVLSIASGMAQAVDGVLLIDEVETAIHSKYFEEIFRFILSAAVKFDVQVFITTHSIEAIDGFLAAQDYDRYPGPDDTLSIITLKKDDRSARSYSRVLSGRHVWQNREQFDFEVRL